MEQHTLEQLKTVAKIRPTYARLELSRSKRLERWADVLERSARPFLNTLYETEYQSPAEQAVMRGDDTPISVAFADPVLRAAGMGTDSYGEAKRFFELSDHQLHNLVCYCHFGAHVSAATVARRLRSMAARNPSGFVARLRAFFG